MVYTAAGSECSCSEAGGAAGQTCTASERSQKRVDVWTEANVTHLGPGACEILTRTVSGGLLKRMIDQL